MLLYFLFMNIIRGDMQMSIDNHTRHAKTFALSPRLLFPPCFGCHIMGCASVVRLAFHYLGGAALARPADIFWRLRDHLLGNGKKGARCDVLLPASVAFFSAPVKKSVQDFCMVCAAALSYRGGVCAARTIRV